MPMQCHWKHIHKLLFSAFLSQQYWHHCQEFPFLLYFYHMKMAPQSTPLSGSSFVYFYHTNVYLWYFNCCCVDPTASWIQVNTWQYTIQSKNILVPNRRERLKTLYNKGKILACNRGEMWHPTPEETNTLKRSTKECWHAAHTDAREV